MNKLHTFGAWALVYLRIIFYTLTSNYDKLADLYIVTGDLKESLRCIDKLPDSESKSYRTAIIHFHMGELPISEVIIQKQFNRNNEVAVSSGLDKLSVRFIREYLPAIGHMALLDNYVKMGILGMRSASTPILLADKVANKHYLEYWRDYLPNIITDADVISKMLPIVPYLEEHLFAIMDKNGNQKLDFSYDTIRAVQRQWEKEGRQPLLKLTKADKSRGHEVLKEWGLSDSDWFVGLHVRQGKEFIRNTRDSDIKSYFPAMESITKRGGWVIYMGSPVMDKLPPMHHVIDYAHSKDRTDWIDIFLCGASRFFIGSQSGLYLVASTFGVPTILTNQLDPLVCGLYSNQLCIYKKRVPPDNKIVSENQLYLSKQGIYFIDNTPEEINDVVIEMMDKFSSEHDITKSVSLVPEKLEKIKVERLNEKV